MLAWATAVAFTFRSLSQNRLSCQLSRARAPGPARARWQRRRRPRQPRRLGRGAPRLERAGQRDAERRRAAETAAERNFALDPDGETAGPAGFPRDGDDRFRGFDGVGAFDEDGDVPADRGRQGGFAIDDRVLAE